MSSLLVTHVNLVQCATYFSRTYKMCAALRMQKRDSFLITQQNVQCSVLRVYKYFSRTNKMCVASFLVTHLKLVQSQVLFSSIACTMCAAIGMGKEKGDTSDACLTYELWSTKHHLGAGVNGQILSCPKINDLQLSCRAVFQHNILWLQWNK